MAKPKTSSIRAKIETLKPWESIVFFPEDYKVFMRGLATAMLRQAIPEVSYKVARVIVDDQLEIGVLVTKTGEES
jgi:hypothetical protein